MERLCTVFDMPETSTLVYLMNVGVAIQFITYTLYWRRELLPLTGDGAAILVSIIASIIDMVMVLLFFYAGGHNPTWNLSVFHYLTPLFLIGLFIQFASDHQKHIFKENPANTGKILQTGLWGLVRAPNHTGFIIWRTAQSIGTMGCVLGFAFVC